MHGVRLCRGLRTLRRAPKPNTSTKAPDLPAPTLEMLRSQLESFPAEQREYLQQLLSTQGNELSQQLKQVSVADPLGETGNKKEQPSELEYVAGLVVGTLETAEKLSDFDKPFWQSVKVLSSIKGGEYTDLFARIFEVAKRMSNPKVRTEAIYMAGTYLYRQKTVRLDPVNEVEYLDSLVAKNRPFRALNYWSSRRERPEVKDTTYWAEVGALYLLEARLFASAIGIIRDIDAKGKLSPRLIAELIKAASRCGQHEILKQWFPVFLDVVKQHELAEVEQVTNLEEVLERITPLDAPGLLRVLEVLVKTRNWDYASVFWQELGHADLKEVVQWMSQSKLSKKSKETPISPFMEALVSYDPQVLLEPSLYYAWLQSLAQLDGAASGDIEFVLETMKEHRLSLTSRQASAVVNTLLKKGLIDEAKHVVELTGAATAAALVLRHFGKANPGAKNEYLTSLKDPLNPLLASEILKGDNLHGYSLEDLALDQYCWRLVWANWAHEGNMRELFQTMVAKGNYQPSLNLVESIVQAFLLDKDPVAAVAVLKFIKEHHDVDVSPLLMASILEMAKKIRQGRMLVFAKPGKSDITVKDGLHWKQVAKKLSDLYGEDLVKEAGSLDFLPM